MKYGVAIDQRTCIGCHACTVACMTGHEVPVGQFRTWVENVDPGTFPNDSRDFAAMRCNHCTNAPYVRIFPTKVLDQCDDGIVDFNGDRCINCKSRMQGRPHDAIYLNGDPGTTAKCNFCAHRVDAGLEPACVVVCSTHSNWVSELHNATSGISGQRRPIPEQASRRHTLLAYESVFVRAGQDVPLSSPPQPPATPRRPHWRPQPMTNTSHRVPEAAAPTVPAPPAAPVQAPPRCHAFSTGSSQRSRCQGV